MEELLEAARARSSSVARKGADGIWRRGEGWGDEDRYEEEDDPHTHRSYRDRLLSNLPNDLKRIEEPSEEYKGLLDELNRRMDNYHLHAKASIRLDCTFDPVLCGGQRSRVRAVA
jgi:hypothetical protein